MWTCRAEVAPHLRARRTAQVDRIDILTMIDDVDFELTWPERVPAQLAAARICEHPGHHPTGPTDHPTDESTCPSSTIATTCSLRGDRMLTRAFATTFIGGLALSASACSSADCSVTGCALGACAWQDGAAACVTECDEFTNFANSDPSYAPPDEIFVCHDGIPARCSDVPPGTHCWECEAFPRDLCGPDAYCFSGDGASDPRDNSCVPSLADGATCTRPGGQHDECVSRNCDAPASGPGGDPVSRVCLVAAGAPCTAEDCAHCIPVDGTPTCFQSCNGPADCEHLPGYVCAPRDPGSYDKLCLPPCSPDRSCPTNFTCVRFIDPNGILPDSYNCR